MADAHSPEETSPPRGVIGRIAFAVGACGLLGAMGADFASVVARHIGHPIAGAVELAQAAEVLSAASAVVGATLAGGHAAVHLVTDRLRPRTRAVLTRLADVLGAISFALVCAGGLWVLHDTIGGHEASDLLGIPFAPLRIAWALGTGVAAAIFLTRAWTGSRAAADDPNRSSAHVGPPS
jgi:TRAP-type C4-dicarboxylate transport system permease small subunit